MHSSLKTLMLCGLVMLAVSGCNTAGNMAREVGGWFNTDKARVVGRNTGAPVNGQVNAGEEVPPASPAGAVTRAPLDNPSATPAGTQAGPQAGTQAGIKAALLISLTGKDAALGKAFQDAAQMAVGDLGAENFELITKDVGSTSADAVRAAHDALQDGAQIILGPLYAERTVDVKNYIAGRIPVLSFSNNSTAAGAGSYVMGFNPAQQVQRVLRYASSKGLQNVAVLAPSSAYGDVAVAAARQSGVTLIETQRYGSSAASVKKAVAALSAKRSGIQAILLPDGGESLKRVAAELTAVALSAHDIPLLGTGLWDEQAVHDHPVLVGSFYAAPEPDARARFMTRYEKIYGTRPPRLATLAYDAAALAATLAKQNAAKQNLHYDERALTNSNGFAGLDGIFRLQADGIAERGLAILEVKTGGAQVADPAPRSF